MATGELRSLTEIIHETNMLYVVHHKTNFSGDLANACYGNAVVIRFVLFSIDNLKKRPLGIPINRTDFTDFWLFLFSFDQRLSC